MMGTKEEIGLRIKTMRKSRNMTQEDLAKAIDQSASSITMYENGRREPSFETLEALADAFNVSLFEFIPVAESDRDFLDEDLLDAPQTPEARILARGIDKLDPEQRAQALAVVKAMFAQHPEIFND